MFNRNYFRQKKACMGSVDEAYIRRFGEHPFDTLEKLVKGGYSHEEAYAVVDRNMRLVSEYLIEKQIAAEEEERERQFRECPFCQPPT